MKNIKNKKSIQWIKTKEKNKRKKQKKKTKESPHNFSNFYVVGDISIFTIKCDAIAPQQRKGAFGSTFSKG